MALLVHLPLTGDLHNQGLADVEITNNGATVDDNGKIGKCYSFDGSDDYISLDSSALYSAIKGNSTPFSIAMWIYCADSTRGILFGDYGLTGAINFNVELTASQQLRFYWGGNDTVASTAIVPLNSWTHIAIVYDGKTINFYVNGVLLYNRTIILDTKNKTAGSYYLGRDSRVGGTAFNGKINDVRIYSHCLSQKEISELKKALVLHYCLDNNGVGNKNISSKYVSCASGNPDNTNNGGRTKHYGDYGVIIPAVEAADTYFTIWTTESLENGQIYTLSANVSGLIEGTYYRFPLFAQNNSSMGTICFDHNGRNSLTFTMNYTGTVNTATVDGKTYYRLFMDDITRNIASGQGEITINNIKLEKGSVATPWCPNSSDALYTALGYDDGIEYDTSGYGNNGTKVGTLSYSIDSPRYLASTVFDDASKYIKDVYAIKGLTMNEISVSFWFSTSSSSESISGDGENFFSFGYNSGLRVRIPKNSTNKIWIYGGFGAITLTSNTSFVDGKWHFLSITFNNGVFKCFIDGIQIDSDVTKSISAITFADNEYYRIATSQNGAEHFVGNLSDFRIYASCLSPLDVEALYKTSGAVDSNGNFYAYEYIEN